MNPNNIDPHDDSASKQEHYSGTGANANPSASSPTLSATDKNNRKLITIVTLAFLILLAVLVALIVALVNKNNGSNTNKSSSNSSEQTTTDSTTTTAKKIIKTVQTEVDNIELVIYTLKQTNTNTTIEYGFHNTCADCTKTTYAPPLYLGKDSVYLLDNNAGQKYNPIVDQNGDVLASPSPEGYVKPKETMDFFIAFTKVPSGSTVSLIMGKYKIDDILIP